MTRFTIEASMGPQLTELEATRRDELFPEDIKVLLDHLGYTPHKVYPESRVHVWYAQARVKLHLNSEGATRPFEIWIYPSGQARMVRRWNEALRLVPDAIAELRDEALSQPMLVQIPS